MLYCLLTLGAETCSVYDHFSNITNGRIKENKKGANALSQERYVDKRNRLPPTIKTATKLSRCQTHPNYLLFMSSLVSRIRSFRICSHPELLKLVCPHKQHLHPSKFHLDPTGRLASSASLIASSTLASLPCESIISPMYIFTAATCLESFLALRLTDPRSFLQWVQTFFFFFFPEAQMSR